MISRLCCSSFYIVIVCFLNKINGDGDLFPTDQTDVSVSVIVTVADKCQYL